MKHRIQFIQIALIALAAPSVALAALGENEVSVQTDQIQMKATRRVVATNNNYAVHELETPAGTLVREYLSPTGAVFAVVWKGPVAPDLRQIMGQHFDTYANSQKTKFEGLNHRTFEQSGLVVQSHGRIHAYSGKAYIQNAIPSGVSVNEIQ
jgi:hypothetical protein